MKLLLKRTFESATYTIGKLSIDGVYFCDTLEDTNRDLNKNGIFDGAEEKIASETCVPYGTYEVIVNVSPRFKRELPRLLNVPSFEGVLIHKGNTAKDTAGCILVGKNTVEGKVTNSTYYEIELTKRIKEAISRGEKVTIQII